MNRFCAIILSIALGIVWGVVAGLLAGFGFIVDYFAPILFMLILSAVIFIGYAVARYFCGVSRLPLILSGSSVIVNTLALALISGLLVDFAVAIGFIFGIAFAVFAATVISVILTR
ncbi:MAG: hypothetical protein IJB24_07365 [Clostridia bacterium]|nr:hypothetical protein [Clostridia bacterium]